MFPDDILDLDVTAAEMRVHLVSLEAERALAHKAGIAEIPAYKADLDEEIECCRWLYVAFAVTEIATLRASSPDPRPDERAAERAEDPPLVGWARRVYGPAEPVSEASPISASPRSRSK